MEEEEEEGGCSVPCYFRPTHTSLSQQSDTALFSLPEYCVIVCACIHNEFLPCRNSIKHAFTVRDSQLMGGSICMAAVLCAHTRVRVCVRACVYYVFDMCVCMLCCVSAYTRACVSACMCTLMGISACLCFLVCLRTRVCVCTCVCVFMCGANMLQSRGQCRGQIQASQAGVSTEALEVI